MQNDSVKGWVAGTSRNEYKCPSWGFPKALQEGKNKVCEVANGMAHPFLRVSVPANSPFLLTLARLHDFIYVTFRQKAAWSIQRVLTKKKYKANLTKEKRNHRHLHGNKKDIIYYFTWPLSSSGNQWINDKIYRAWKVGKQDLQHLKVWVPGMNIRCISLLNPLFPKESGPSLNIISLVSFKF